MSGLTEEAKGILKAAVSKSKNPFGTVIRVRPLDGVITIKMRHEVLISGKGGAIAVWESALEELVIQGLLKLNKRVKDDPQTQMFQVTPQGYECAESLGLLS